MERRIHASTQIDVIRGSKIPLDFDRCVFIMKVNVVLMQQQSCEEVFSGDLTILLDDNLSVGQINPDIRWFISFGDDVIIQHRVMRMAQGDQIEIPLPGEPA